MIRPALLLAICAILASPVEAQPSRPFADLRTLQPTAESSRDPAFHRFRRFLEQAVRTRDAAALKRLIRPDAKGSFGPDAGREALLARWGGDQRDSDLWRELEGILALGGTFVHGVYTAPFIAASFPSDLDPLTHVVAVGRDPVVRTAPEPDAPVLARVPNAILAAPDGVSSPWVRVSYRDQVGYIAAGQVRSPIGTRSIAEKRAGRWLISAIVAGD